MAGLTLAGSPASAGTPATPDEGTAGGAVVEQQVRDELAADGSTSFWVHLQAKADLQAAEQIDDWVARGQYVYDQLTSTAQSSQAELVAMLDDAGVDYQTFWISNTVKVTGDQALLDRITAMSEVEEITADRVYQVPDPPSGQEESRIDAVEWNIDRINAPQVWSDFGVTGEDIVVANMDTGVQYDHPALVNQYRGNLGGGSFDHNYNWFDPSNICGNPSLEPCDNNGHGTHTMGTMVGDDGGDNQIGVAPGAKWIAAKGCESSSCSTGALLASFEWFLAPTDLQGENPDPAMRPHVVNNSWGNNNGSDTTYQDSVQAWVAAGIFPSFSNGNAGPGCGTVGAPASYPESYGVGAFDINDNIAGFSSRGASPIDGGIKPNISAPGVNVRSSVPTDGYTSLNGTSMAAPHLSGAVALMWSASVALQGDLDGTRALLDTTAIDTEDLSCGGTPDNNNVWGQGRLDAFAAVDQSPRGPTGTLEGTVTDSQSGDPIQGATITITGPVDRERTTDENGHYSVTLPVGDFQVTAEAFGYLPQTAQVSIAEDQTTTRNFDLDPAPSATISGTVTDGSGHDWPLYARIEVGGAPIPDVFTDPVTGSYSFDLPEGTTVTLTVNAVSGGYDAESREVTAEPGGQVEDFVLTVGTSCTAPGYEFVDLSGASEGGVESSFGDRTLEVSSRAAPAASPAAVGDGSLTTTFASNNGFAGNTFDINPIVPLFVAGFDVNITPAGGEHTVTIYWKEGTAEGFESDPEPWNVLGSDVVSSAGLNQPTHVDVGGLQIMPGTTYGIYVDLESYPSGTLRYTNGGPTTFSNDELELTTYVGKGNPAFLGDTFTPRMWNGTVHYDIGEFECLPTAGGLLVGNVRDANTGAGVNGATVTSDNEPSETTTSFGTPDDPNVDDGFYILFSSLTGAQPFTATMGDQYGSDTRTPDVVADEIVVQDLHLPAGQLEIEPANVEAEVRFGQSADRTFTITNTGTAPAEVELSERSSRFEILHPELAAPESADFSGRAPVGPSSVRSAEGQATLATGPDSPDWSSGPDAPAGIVRYAHTQCEGEPDAFYVISGVSNGALVDTVWRFDATTNEWTTLAPIPTGQEAPTAACFDGRIYAMGGGGTSQHFVYDIATDTWMAAAGLPRGVQGAAAGAFDGKVYLIGGDSDFLPSNGISDEVNVYDIATDSWSSGSPMPVAVSEAGTFQAGEFVYAVGGWGVSAPGSNANATQRYDMSSDSWETGPEFTIAKADHALAATSDALYAIGGDTDGGGFFEATASVHRLDLGAWPGGAWADLDDPLPAPRTANTAGFCTNAVTGGETWSVGGLNAAFAWQDDAFYREAGEACGAADVPWLDVDPLTATLQPGDTVTVTVSMDSSATEEQQPGAYTAGVGIREDTPYSVDPVGVTMNVTPPNNWGKITGTVTGVACDGTETPLAGATVQINGKRQEITLSTGADGGYARWMAVNNSPLTLIVAQDGYIPQTREASLNPRQTATEDFALQAACVRASGNHPM